MNFVVAQLQARELVQWQQQCPDPSPDAFIFAGPRGGFMDSSNYRKRVLHKLATELELPKLTFQVIRRTIATLAQKKGTVKDVQGMMRHSRTATTTDVYMQEMPDGGRATVNSIHEELMGTGTAGLASRDPTAASGNTRDECEVPNSTKNPSRPKRQNTSSPQEGIAGTKPVREVVLEFATGMRQGRGREGF